MIDYLNDMKDEIDIKDEILDELFEFVSIKDAAGYWVSVNQNAENLMLYNQLQLLGGNFSVVLCQMPNCLSYYRNNNI